MQSGGEAGETQVRAGCALGPIVAPSLPCVPHAPSDSDNCTPCGEPMSPCTGNIAMQPCWSSLRMHALLPATALNEQPRAVPVGAHVAV